MSIIPDIRAFTEAVTEPEVPVPGTRDEPTGLDEHTTGFALSIDGGPVVSAALVGDRWQLTFRGKGNDDTCLLAVDEHEARIAAVQLAQRLNDLEPGRQSYELQRKALSLWLKSLARGDEQS